MPHSERYVNISTESAPHRDAFPPADVRRFEILVGNLPKLHPRYLGSSNRQEAFSRRLRPHPIGRCRERDENTRVCAGSRITVRKSLSIHRFACKKTL